MRFAAFRQNGADGLAVSADGNGRFHGRLATDGTYPGKLADLVARGSERLLEAVAPR